MRHTKKEQEEREKYLTWQGKLAPLDIAQAPAAGHLDIMAQWKDSAGEQGSYHLPMLAFTVVELDP